jgi:hypothetical protein
MKTKIDKASFRFPGRLDKIGWPKFVRKLFDLAYGNYGLKNWSVIEESINGKIFYKTDIEFDRDIPVISRLKKHGINTNKITLYVEPFSWSPEKLVLDQLIEKSEKVSMLLTCRSEYPTDYVKPLHEAYKTYGKLIAPIDLSDIEEANERARRGDVEGLDCMIGEMMHLVMNGRV